MQLFTHIYQLKLIPPTGKEYLIKQIIAPLWRDYLDSLTQITMYQHAFAAFSCFLLIYGKNCIAALHLCRPCYFSMSCKPFFKLFNGETPAAFSLTLFIRSPTAGSFPGAWAAEGVVYSLRANGPHSPLAF